MAQKETKIEILVTDDEKDVRDAVKETLTLEGYNVDTAKDGRECIKKLRKKKYDLVLMDMFMPGMSGRETVKNIREDEELHDTRIAFLTAAEFSLQGEKKLKDLKSLDYIKKPFDLDDLRSRVRKLTKK